MLSVRGVVGKFVEFYGPGTTHLSLADRCEVLDLDFYNRGIKYWPVSAYRNEVLEEVLGKGSVQFERFFLEP